MGIDQLPSDLNRISPIGTIFTLNVYAWRLDASDRYMLYLWIFADNIEDDLGTLNFVIFYFVCGIGAAMSRFNRCKFSNLR